MEHEAVKLVGGKELRGEGENVLYPNLLVFFKPYANNNCRMVSIVYLTRTK